MKTVRIAGKELEIFEVLDARELNCPMPLLRAKKRMAKIPLGAILQIDGTDPNSKKDIISWCQRSANRYMGETVMQTFTSFYIKKGTL